MQELLFKLYLQCSTPHGLQETFPVTSSVTYITDGLYQTGAKPEGMPLYYFSKEAITIGAS
jgi:hypothetical protein